MLYPSIEIFKNETDGLTARSRTDLRSGHVCGSDRFPMYLLPTDNISAKASGDAAYKHNLLLTGKVDATLDETFAPDSKLARVACVLGGKHVFGLGYESPVLYKIYVLNEAGDGLVAIDTDFTTSVLWPCSDGKTMFLVPYTDAGGDREGHLIRVTYTGGTAFDSVEDLGEFPEIHANEKFASWSFGETGKAYQWGGYDVTSTLGGVGDRHIWRLEKVTGSTLKLDHTVPDGQIRHFHAFGFNPQSGVPHASYGDWNGVDDGTNNTFNCILVRSNDEPDGVWSEAFAPNSRYYQPVRFRDFGHETKQIACGDDYSQLTTFDTVSYETEPLCVQSNTFTSNLLFMFDCRRFGDLYIAATRDKNANSRNFLIASVDLVHWVIIHQFPSDDLSGVHRLAGVVDGVLYGDHDDGWFSMPLPDYRVIEAVQCEPAVTNIFTDSDVVTTSGWFAQWSPFNNVCQVASETSPRGETTIHVERANDQAGSSTVESPPVDVSTGDVVYGGIWLKSSNYTPVNVAIQGKNGSSGTTTGNTNIHFLYPNQWRWCEIAPYEVEDGTTAVRARVGILQFDEPLSNTPDANFDIGGVTLQKSPVGSWAKTARNSTQLDFVGNFKARWTSLLLAVPLQENRHIGPATAYVASWSAGDTDLQFSWNGTSSRWELLVSDGTNTETLYSTAAKFDRGSMVRVVVQRDSDGKIRCSVQNGGDIEALTVDGASAVTVNAYDAVDTAGQICYGDSNGANGLPCMIGDVRLVGRYLSSTELAAEIDRLD